MAYLSQCDDREENTDTSIPDVVQCIKVRRMIAVDGNCKKSLEGTHLLDCVSSLL